MRFDFSLLEILAEFSFCHFSPNRCQLAFDLLPFCFEACNCFLCGWDLSLRHGKDGFRESFEAGVLGFTRETW